MDKISIIVVIICFALCAFAAALMTGYATGDALRSSECQEYILRFEECKARFNSECMFKGQGMFGYENFSFNVSLDK